MIIETHQLKQLMNEGHDNLTILHAMVEPPETKVKDPMNNLCKFYNMMNKGHIPTARVFPLIPYSDLQSGFNLMMPKQERFREIARNLDLRINDTFVCYDFDVVHSASRLAWTLKGFGAKKVHVLNGTQDKWEREKHEVCFDYEPDYKIPRRQLATDKDYDFTLDTEIIYDFERMKTVSDSNLMNPQNSIPLIDTKVKNFYDVGNIPSSKNLPHYLLLKQNMTEFKDEAQLQQLIQQETGVRNLKEGPIVVSCQNGLTASTMCTVLANIGNNQVSLYDGSYQEWSSRIQMS